MISIVCGAVVFCPCSSNLLENPLCYFPHKRLLLKLSCLGIKGPLLSVISDFLHNRTQRVKVNGTFSPWTNVASGIPQGSILGPLLFVIFINDIPEEVSNMCKIFADDTKIIGTPGPSIQNDLDKVLKWASDWSMNFNPSKCVALHFGRNNPIRAYYMICNSQAHKVAVQSQEKDIGVTFDSALSFDVHVTNVTNKANLMIGLVKRSFTFMNNEIFTRLADPVWANQT